MLNTPTNPPKTAAHGVKIKAKKFQLFKKEFVILVVL